MTSVLGSFERKDGTSSNPRSGDTELKAMLTEIVHTYEFSRPRSQQVRIGPSEIGEPCARKLAYKLAGMPVPEESRGDPWYAIIGTAVHAWLAESLQRQNELSREAGLAEPWLVEHRVEVAPGLTGTMDAFLIPKGVVLDHKVVGKTKHAKVRRHGPGDVYRGQAHAYGLGAWRAGYQVQKVAIAFFPRTTDLRNLYVWSEPFDPDVALRALRRVDVVRELVRKLNPVRDPRQFVRIPKTVGDGCEYCPWRSPGPDTGERCPGDLQDL